MQFPRPAALIFSSPTQMLDYVTANWRRNFVTSDLVDEELLGIFSKRPFFMLVSVDAPLRLRYDRSRRTVTRSLDDFVREDDALLYGYDGDALQDLFKKKSTQRVSSLHKLAKLVTVHVINSYTSVSSLYSHLEKLDLTSMDRLRPSWDTYFMTLASLASMRSNCMKRRVGAILVRNSRIVATGYNGAPRGIKNCNDGGCARCNGQDLRREFCLCIHAEENALLEAGRERCEGGTLYCNTCPCLTCTIKIVQAGVKEVVYSLSYKVDEASAKVFEEAGVRLRRYAPPPQD
ncbi:hypothetical protein DENSPDRAFT_833135 [Dentipellis sp. KUC8613]|nr:hypothetical protein DENSPDRAFT_833135 [Dentipellis sp. KUC8613]